LAPSGVGRPRSYCSSRCKAAARLERRRLDRGLERLETYSAALRLMNDPDKQLPKVEAEMSRITARLLALLG
jgi:hypothetical protein